MISEDYADLRAYLACEGLRLDNDVQYWEDELLRFPLACVAQSLSYALARREIFNQVSRDISELLRL